MFWKKQEKSSVSEDEKIRQLLEAARRSGDKKTELTFRLIQVSTEAEKIRASMGAITDIYSDALSDLTTEACHLFPTDLAVAIEDLEALTESIFEEVESLADRSGDIVLRISKLQGLKA